MTRWAPSRTSALRSTGSLHRTAPLRPIGSPLWTGLPLLGGLFVAALVLLLAAGCSTGDPVAEPGDPVEFTVPPGASFQQVTDTLVARDLVRAPHLFRAFARIRGDDRNVHSGRYSVPPGEDWSSLLQRLVNGEVVTVALTVPEGFTLAQMAPRIAELTGRPAEEVLERLSEPEAHTALGLPGPGLEGYLFPDTYRFAPETSVEQVIRVMAARYRTLWTEDRRDRAEAMGMSEQEVTTLASIVQAEARHSWEMPRIASVFLNRIQRGYPLQADPTVQYALAERRSRLLYSDIDSVADHPYNTYRRRGLPPGPIGAPGEAAVDAVLDPEDSSYMYFVARPDGSHIFTRTLTEHNRARVEARREWDAAARNSGGGT
ncbi:MAG: endolytic transglycosylase MltG [Gemmatimonadales bacterium]|nr:MAG: endolytic transglycosylase MltG [Gemmatimonadales bacterium]